MDGDDIRAALADLPENIQGLLDTSESPFRIEELLRELETSEYLPDSDREFLYDLLGWMMHVFATAGKPMSERNLKNIGSRINEILSDIRSNSWHSIREPRGQSVLEYLSYIPSRRFHQAVDLAQLDRSRDEAQCRIADYQREVQEAREHAEAKIRAAQESFQSATTEECQSVAGTAKGYGVEFQKIAQEVQKRHAEISDGMDHLLVALEKRYGFVATQVLGGSHEIAAKVEKETSDRHKKRARWCAIAATVWAVLIAAWEKVGPAFGWVDKQGQWLDLVGPLPVLGSPVAILIFLAIWEGRMAKTHSAYHVRLQSLELQLKSWEPYLSTLSKDARTEMEKAITPKLFVGDIGATHLTTPP